MMVEDKQTHKVVWSLVVVFAIMIAIFTYFVVTFIQTQNDIREAKAIVWNEVSYPQGNVGVVVPDAVKPGATITITYKEYCNLGVDVSITRWVDFLRPDGTRSASYGLRPLEFAPVESEFGCVKNLRQPLTIPPDLTGRPDGADTVRLRTVTTYIKPQQVIEVPAFSESFLLLPNP